MSNIPKEVRKLKKSLENQASKLLEEKEADLIEKKFCYVQKEQVNPYITFYYFIRQG